MPRKMPERVLILGATSAIAMAVAQRLAEKGARLFLVARNPERLAAVRQDLLTRGAVSVTVQTMDLDETAADAGGSRGSAGDH